MLWTRIHLEKLESVEYNRTAHPNEVNACRQRKANEGRRIISGLKDKRTNGQMDKRMTDRRTRQWTNERTDGRTKERTNERKNRQTTGERRAVFPLESKKRTCNYILT